MRLAVALVLLNCAAGAQTASTTGGASSNPPARISTYFEVLEPPRSNPIRSDAKPWDFGGLIQSGFGVTEDRGGFKFFMAGIHAGKVLSTLHGRGMMRGNFEYAVEAFPFWQSYTPTGLRQNCTVAAGPVGGVGAQCSAPFTIGGTFTGASITTIILRWNFAGTRRFAPWAQGAGGLL